ncbi:hypothetical protein BSR29_04130 [Boudabousia liubingyangii]|uniref:Uncharacterized protein n=1 Tax=Boudabousia liubingyangii TaxID=1921764 RepID=A0A1Q5PNM4_9ACTO|nr:hypothetical protein [Boudabousia liubingyangii]OKL47606.1 hypothetical protein BSR28_03700 [Boudabousia liubingyangii]OKL49030.1 hypothetical protein BSR29_04130 [Boudabousia liubingyangii]
MWNTLSQTKQARPERLQHAREVLKAAESQLGVNSQKEKQCQRVVQLGIEGAARETGRRKSPTRLRNDSWLELYRSVGMQQAAHRSWIAFVGLAHLGWACCLEQGVDLEHVITIPQPEKENAWQVCAVLSEAIPLVVVNARLFSASQLRKLQARAFRNGAQILTSPPISGRNETKRQLAIGKVG